MANEGIKALRKIQFGRMADSDSDTAIAATTIWRGTGTIEDIRNLYFVSEDVGILAGTDRTNTSSHGGALVIDATECTPEQLPHLLEMGIETVTPTSDSGDGYIYQYDFPTTTPNTFKPYTIEGGDNAGAEVMNYCFADEITISGNEQEAWMMGANLLGKTVTPQAFTGALTLPAVTHFNFGMSNLYIDDDSGTFGGTLVSSTLLQAEFKYKTGFVPKFTADGSLSFKFVQSTMPEGILSVTFEHNASAIAEKADWRAEVARLIRIRTQGNAFTVPGSTYTHRTKIIDLAGKWEKFEKLGERNGNDVLEGSFRMRYNATAASAGKIIVVNNLPSLP